MTEGGPPRPERVRAYQLGHQAERRAALALMLKGYRILGRRVRTPVVEIDLIAKRGGTIAFVEVKARISVGAAVEAVRPSLRRRLVRGSDIWLSRNPRYAAATLRFDIMVVNPGRWPIHLPNAFETDQ